MAGLGTSFRVSKFAGESGQGSFGSLDTSQSGVLLTIATASWMSVLNSFLDTYLVVLT